MMVDELGAHVSVAGGVDRAPERAAAIRSAVVQVFTKQPNRWAEREVEAALAEAFATERARHRITQVASHDSYLINLASPDSTLHARSYASFTAELRRCAALRVDFLVTHPGNATDDDPPSGLARNAAAIERAVLEVPGDTVVLLETTAGAGRVLGATFEELADMLERMSPEARARMGVCLDTCHVWAAGYDLVADWDDVFARFDDVLGLERLRLFHLNDSVGQLGSRRDRHAWIGDGTIGQEPFRRLMTDERFTSVPKVLETPKGDDHVASDLRNLELLRSFRS
ncbi:MAG: deoxyribonuclease IV [Gemmatimonadota bacterium]